MAEPLPQPVGTITMSTFNPSVFSLPFQPLPTNSHPSATLDEQQETERIISQLLHTIPALAMDGPNGAGGGTTTTTATTTLRKAEHAGYFQQLFFRLPPGFVSLDASKPWLMYWTVHSLDLLGIALDQGTKDRAISTMSHMRHPSGGFSGGPSNSQIPHLLATYASTCTLAIVGNDGPAGGWKQVADARQGIYDLFMRCKRPDGGFVVCAGGELDVRGTYCLLVVATLLDFLTPELLHSVDKFISACQTYEGGFACSSFPFPSLQAPTSRAALAEAHGGYTSCALNSHFLLSSIRPPSLNSSSLEESFPSKIDVDGAMRWSALMQGEAIEGGGFRGRSNKLVDGCYSWWVGGGVPVIEALAKREKEEKREKKRQRQEARIEVEGDGWEDVIPSPPLFNKTALQEYILLAAQNEPGQRGGLRDKPGKRPDQYHTCNNLSGLSVAQHNVIHSPSVVQANRQKFDMTKGLPPVKPTRPEGGWASEEERQAVRREVWANALGWVEEGEATILGGKESRVNTTAPVFNILLLRLKPFINYFYGQTA